MILPQVYLVADMADSVSCCKGIMDAHRLVEFNYLTEQDGYKKASLSTEPRAVYLPKRMSLSQALFMISVFEPALQMSDIQEQITCLASFFSYISCHPSQSSIDYLIRINGYARALGCMQIQCAINKTMQDIKLFIENQKAIRASFINSA